MSKDILILTSYTDHIRWNNYGKCDYGDIASINHHEYANTHGYSYLKRIVRDSDFSEWHPTWIKVKVILDEIEKYDYVVWIDADAVFLDKSIRIEDLLEEETCLVLPKIEIDRVTGNVWTNTTTGFMVWKNCDWSLEKLRNLWNFPGGYRFADFHEQSRLDEILSEYYEKEGMENIKNREHIDLVNKVSSGEVTILPFSYHRYYLDFDKTPYVYHAGGSTPTKRERIEEAIGNVPD